MQRQDETLARRDFFRKAGLGAGAAGVAAGVAAVSVVTGGSARAAEPVQGGSGYRVTEHVKQAYQTARF